MRWQGEGSQNLVDMAQYAQDQGKTLHSDNTLSSPQVGAYRKAQDDGLIDFDHQNSKTEAQFNKIGSGSKNSTAIIDGKGAPVLTNIRLPPSLGDSMPGS